jgi:hypothetical protein
MNQLMRVSGTNFTAEKQKNQKVHGCTEAVVCHGELVW